MIGSPSEPLSLELACVALRHEVREHVQPVVFHPELLQTSAFAGSLGVMTVVRAPTANYPVMSPILGQSDIRTIISVLAFRRWFMDVTSRTDLTSAIYVLERIIRGPNLSVSPSQPRDREKAGLGIVAWCRTCDDPALVLGHVLSPAF